MSERESPPIDNDVLARLPPWIRALEELRRRARAMKPNEVQESASDDSVASTSTGGSVSPLSPKILKETEKNGVQLSSSEAEGR